MAPIEVEPEIEPEEEIIEESPEFEAAQPAKYNPFANYTHGTRRKTISKSDNPFVSNHNYWR